MGTNTVEIRPEVAIYAAFTRFDYEAWYASAEFVDNPLQSFLSNREALKAVDGPASRLRVYIDFSADRIIVRDNAAGISERDFARAFLPASPPPDTTGLSEFGLGMKAAACWFARHWSMRTTAVGEPVERTITYDIPTIIAERMSWLPVQESLAAAKAHYSILTLEQLNVRPKPSTVAKIKRHLASIYRMFLRDGLLELWVNGEPLEHTPSPLLRAARFDDPSGPPIEWRKELHFQLDSAHEIRGWAGILARASVTNAGFSIFRRGRLIEGSYGEAWRPEIIFRKSNSYTFQRLVGELSIQGFSVSHTKDGVQWNDREEDILSWLRSELDAEPLPLLRQAENYRARQRRSPIVVERALEDTQRVLAQRLGPLVDTQLNRPPESEQLPLRLEPVEPQARRETTLSLQHAGRSWRLQIEILADETVFDWLEIAQDEPQRAEHFLQIRINIAHPFIARFTSPTGAELTGFVRLAAGLAIAEATARVTGVRQAGTIRRNLNQLLRDVLAEPIHVLDSDDPDLDNGT